MGQQGRTGCQVILDSSPAAWRSTRSYSSITSTTSSYTMMLRLVLVWTVVSAVAAFDVFGASHEAPHQGNLYEENKIQLVEDEYLEDDHRIGLEQELEEEEDEEEDEDSQQFEESDEEDCYEDTCVEEAYPGVRNVGLLGKVVKTLSYLAQGR